MPPFNMQPLKNPMPTQDAEIRKNNFNEVALGYTPQQAIDEAKRCIRCKNRPCVAGCPVRVKIPEFIAKMAEGDFEGAYQIIAEDSALPARLAQEENSVCISAKAGLNLDKLLEMIAENLKLKAVEEYFLIPYSESAVAAKLHSIGTVLEQEYLAEGTQLKVRLDANQLGEFEKYLSKGE